MASFHANLVQSFKNFKDKYIGNTSIAAIGDGTLTGAVAQIKSDLTIKLRASANASTYTTYSAMLLHLATTYATLTDVEKQRAYLILEYSGSATQFNMTDYVRGVFTNCDGGSNYFSINHMDMSGIYENCVINNGAISYNNASSTASSGIMYLYA